MSENLSDLVKKEPIVESNEENTIANENLSDLVKRESDVENSKEDIIEEKNEVSQSETEESNIEIISLTDWFEQNNQFLNNIKQVKVAIRGVNPRENLIVSIIDDSGEKDENGNDKRKLRIFENADSSPVLNLEPFKMDIFNNGFQIIYKFSGSIIKCYGVKTGLFVVFCIEIDNMLIPYSINRLKRKETEIKSIIVDENKIKSELSQNADIEGLHLLYKQSSKSSKNLVTKYDVVSWLVERQSEVTDINHLLQIDNVIINLL